MTVCLASLASESRAVVCVADKSLAYGDDIQWDSDSSKMFRLNPSGAVVMFAGSETPISELVARLIVIQEQLGVSKAQTKRLVEAECVHAIEFLIDHEFLIPGRLTREEYVAGTTGGTINPHMEALARDIKTYNFDCSLLICGSENLRPWVLHVDERGVATDLTTTGFQAIGAGWEKATSRLLFSEHTRAHDIARVLYDAFDAKVFAEMTPHVGFDWDAWVMFPGVLGTHLVPESIKELISRAWVKYNRSPFENYDPREDLPGPPRDWKDQLEHFSQLMILASANNTEAIQKLIDMNDGEPTRLTFET
jgi:hypothetical protein